mmetsp:Transcript_42551/g.69005  ORF Transcript_42551/g.69005 Transcript_42551/m.69005 type:complete len:204 (+) Transcript_42551:101-712(+)|eukprot:CAMPEP_0184654108 /NCGR_PEP_ID=MMETSP0308-20130426/11809_1 /TAXON_ID=38269 /ORGANISM="Gloeochaete witrockiana, Strain SAG 46.84" /LENGTH=203 /DNA_ID=CAMNT_0027089941 /DNA_START=86 /DNA_END=697 /DNA_ORIENTATION=-
MSISEYNGGAIVAMVGKNCVAIASDKRFGIQMRTIACNTPKVYKLHDTLYVGFSGIITDMQTLYEKFKFRLNMYKLREEREMKPSVFAHLASNLLYEKRFGPYFAEPFIAGIENGKPYINSMDLIGALGEEKEFVVGGTCQEELYGTCESMYKPDLEPEDLFETISQALLSSVDRDCLSGWGAVVYIITPEETIVRHLKARMD